MKNFPIIYSETEPNKECLWLHNGTLKYFGPNGWQEINCNSTYCTSTTTTSTSYPVVTFVNDFNIPINILGVCANETCTATGYDVIPSKGTIFAYRLIPDNSIKIIPSYTSLHEFYQFYAKDTYTGATIPVSYVSDIRQYCISSSYLINNNITSVTLFGVTTLDTTTTTSPPDPNKSTTTLPPIILANIKNINYDTVLFASYYTGGEVELSTGKDEFFECSDEYPYVLIRKEGIAFSPDTKVYIYNGSTYTTELGYSYYTVENGHLKINAYKIYIDTGNCMLGI